LQLFVVSDGTQYDKQIHVYRQMDAHWLPFVCLGR